MLFNSKALSADRYHLVMGNFALGVDPLEIDQVIGEMPATFYVSERKLPYAPALGHERMIHLLNNSRADEPRARFLRDDVAHVEIIAEKLRHSRFPGKVDVVPEGTIIFANEPIAMIHGPFAMTQMFEVIFEHAFDEPMTFAYQAMKMREVVGQDISISDFSLRRAGSLERATEATKYLYIGGCDNTSNLEAAFLYGIASIGTMAHYLVQVFLALVTSLAKSNDKVPRSWYDEDGNIKHGERLCFEFWLDAHPQGTVCLVDTISLELGMIHVIEAALSSPARRKALKAVRIDSGDLVKGIIFARSILDANGLHEVKIIPTGDLDYLKVREIALGLLSRVNGTEIDSTDEEAIRDTLKRFGITGVAAGTRFVAEFDQVAGIIFKMIEFRDEPTLKLSEMSGKETLPGELQLWRCENTAGQYVLDVISKADEPSPQGKDIVKANPLIQPYWSQGLSPELKTVHELKSWVVEQKERFIIPLEQYASERVVLSEALQKLRDRLKATYLESPPTRIKMADNINRE